MDQRKDDANWSPPRQHLEIGDSPADFNTGRVQGRRLTGPQQGFGQLWQKTYKVAIPNRTPEQIIATWKAEYGRFWPSNSRFYAPVTGIKPGEGDLWLRVGEDRQAQAHKNVKKYDITRKRKANA